MIKLCVSFTYANRESLIFYNKEDGFKNTISKLEDIYENAEYSGIETTGLTEIIWLFNQFEEIQEHNCNFGNSAYISDKEKFISKISSYAYCKKSNNIYDSWLIMLHNLNETIDEFFRYGAKDTDNHIIFLKNILIFLSYITLYENAQDFKYLY